MLHKNARFAVLLAGLFLFLNVLSADDLPVVAEQNEIAPASLFPDGLEIPLCEANDGDDDTADHQIRQFYGYTICYRESYEQPEWAAYTLTPEKLEKNASRGDNFRPDPEITTGSAELADYRGSGYDRGHLAPAADMAYNSEAMSDSFYLSNMSPQTGSFNRGIWAQAEAYVRATAADYDVTYVVTGPVLDKSTDDFGSIGINKVAVPEYYYKVALFVRNPESENPEMDVWAILIPNAKGEDVLESYRVSVDEIEEVTGLDLFYTMEDSMETMLESSSRVLSID